MVMAAAAVVAMPRLRGRDPYAGDRAALWPVRVSRGYVRDRARRLKPLPRPGWPKMAPCLYCGLLRLASGPDDRLHVPCRRYQAAIGRPTKLK